MTKKNSGHNERIDGDKFPSGRMTNRRAYRHSGVRICRFSRDGCKFSAVYMHSSATQTASNIDVMCS